MLFRLLGRVQIDTANGTFPIQSAPVRGVLAALLLEEGRFIPVGKLLNALWNDPPSSARQNLRLYIARLRTQLAALSLQERLITLRGGVGGYSLSISPDELDAFRFQHLAEKGGMELQAGSFTRAERALREALSLWRGPIGQDCTASEQLRAQFQTYEKLHLTVRERLVEARLGLGATVDLVPEIRGILEIAPFRETSWADLIRACYLGGDISGALAAWRQVVELFRGELGVDPSIRLRELHAAVLRRDDAAVRAYVPSAVVARSLGNAS